MKRVILGFFSCLVCVFVMFCAHGAGYVCNSIKYTECNAGYYMTYNGVADSIPKADNDCTACPSGAKCAGGTAGPVYSCSSGYYYSGSGCISCDENYYCPGGYEGKQLCPSAYALADGDAGGAKDCYLILNPGNYVATAHGGQTACPAGSYCPGGSRVYYENTGGATTCPANSNSSAGATECTCNTGYNYNGGTTTTTNACVANTYTIKYDANGGTGTMSDTTCTYGSNCALRTNAFTKTGYTFAGWTYNGTSYSNGQTVSNLTSTNGATLTFTAQWTANTYTIKYDANGGTGTISNTTCTYGSDCTLRTNTFTKTGYTFAGWTYNGTTYSNGATVKNLSSTNGATLTFTAQWTANTYTLTLDRNDATSGDTTATIQYGANGFCSAGSKTDTTCSLNVYTPYKTGYRFNGYFTEQTGGTMWIDNNGYPVSSTIITSSRTLYAQYTANKYSCPAGEYLSGTSCVTCPAGSYCPGVTDQEYIGGVHGLNTCPAGYNDDVSVGKSSVSDCKIRCVGGYIAKQYDTRCTDVGVGNWAPLKYVGYGQISSPESCPDGMLSSGFGVSSDEIGDCGRILWVNNSPVFAGYVKKTTPSLNIKYQNTVYYASMTPVSELSSDYKEWQEDIMHVNYKGVKYVVHDDRMSTTLLDTDDAYLESSGTQYIDLGYYPTDNTRVKVTMMDTRSDAGAETVYRWLFGNISRASGGKTTCFGLGTYLENWYTEISGSNISVAPLDVNTKYSLTFTVPELYFNNQSYKTKGSYATYTPADYPMYMFANNNAGAIYDQLFVGRIYDFKIYESDKLVRHLVPVPAGKQIGDFIVPQNGMWDIVEWKFYANKGTGNFVYGIAN